jgi:LPS sulfotransferase NodH
VTGETPAAHLARLKVTYPAWTFWKGEQTGEYWAQPPARHEHQQLVHAATVDALEARIRDIEHDRRPPA